MPAVSTNHVGAVSPDDLIAFIDGEAPADVIAHIQHCPICAKEASEYKGTQTSLTKHLYRFDCPSPNALGDYELGMLQAEARTAIGSHVVACPRCADELAQLRAYLHFDTAPPLGMVERVRRVIATLLSPPATPALAGLRGAGDSPVQTYDADGITITLGPGSAARPRPGHTSLSGLLFGEPVTAPDAIAGAAVTLVDESDQPHTTTLDDLGNFTFDDLAAGTYRLEVTLGDRVVVVEGLALGR
jgi:anti-sigma factor RsiW